MPLQNVQRSLLRKEGYGKTKKLLLKVRNRRNVEAGYTGIPSFHTLRTASDGRRPSVVYVLPKKEKEFVKL